MAFTRPRRGLFTARVRRWVAGVLATALLFMQLAVAAYACPGPRAPVVAMAEMPGCQGMAAQPDADQPQLCKAHCDQDSRTPAGNPALDLQPNPAAAMLLQGLVCPAPLPGLSATAPGQGPSVGPPPGSPPLYLTLLVLRN